MTFHPGQQFEHGRVWYRIRSGNRCEGDMVIEISTNGIHWVQPLIAHTLIMSAFKFQVEENNYGKNGRIKKARGGWMLIDRIIDACRNGWEQAAQNTSVEAKEAEEKRHLFAQSQLSLL